MPSPAGSPSPLGPLGSTNANTLLMNSGDELIVALEDTARGLKITVQDLTIPGTVDDFGGDSQHEYGPILALFYPAPKFQPQLIYEAFHRTLNFNPCSMFEDQDDNEQ